jgi:hypothetical protein
MAVQMTLNELSGDFAVAQSLFDRADSAFDSQSLPTSSSSSATFRGNPNIGLSPAVDYLQAPSGFQAFDILVADDYGAERINNSKEIFLQDEFWSNPDQVADRADCPANQSIDQIVLGTRWKEDALQRKNHDQKISKCSPKQIGFGAKDFDITHKSIFAVTATNRVGL